MRYRSNPSRRAVRNNLAVLDALANGTTPVIEQPKPRAKRKGRTPEGQVSEAIKAWARLRPDVTIYRNNTGAYEWKPGKWIRYGLAVGSSDFIGYQTVTIRQSMVGQKFARFFALECKAEEGVVSEDQLRFIESVRDAGGLAGVARSIEEAEALAAVGAFGTRDDR